MATIESFAHVAEDLIGLVRDEGAPLDGYLIDLLLEAGDRLRSMMEIAVSARRDADERSCEPTLEKMREKFARLCGGALHEGPSSVSSHEASRHGDLNPAVFEVRKVGCVPEFPSENCVGDEGINSDGKSFGETDESFETAIVFGPCQDKLADDPLYFQIFLDMANESIVSIRDALRSGLDSGDRSRSIIDAAERMHFGATRIGISDWADLAAGIISSAEDPTRVGALLAEAEAHYSKARRPSGGLEDCATVSKEEVEAETGLAGSVPEGSPAPHLETRDEFSGPGGFLKEIVPYLDGLCETLISVAAPESSLIDPFCAPIQKAAARQGYVRIADTVAELPSSLANSHRFEELFTELHDDLTLIEDSEIGLTSQVEASSKSAMLLKSWYVTRMPRTLDELALLLEKPAEDVDWGRVVELQGRLRRACSYLGFDVGGRVASILTDLAARVVSGEIRPDSLLARVMLSFSNATRPLFTSKALGVPDDDVMGRLLVETREVTEALSGTAPVRSFEAVLKLPQSFQGVLSPDSAKSAAEAFANGARFYIIRADTDSQPELTNRFFDWANGCGKMIGCVTVPCEKPVFDFLLASQFDCDGVKAELLDLDPTGEGLFVVEALCQNGADGEEAATDELSGGGKFDGGRASANSAQMLESIEELVTGHGAIRDILAGFDQKRLLDVIDQSIAAYGSWAKAREAVSRQLQDWQDGVEHLIQIESQLDKRLQQLQEDAVGARMRPAERLIQYLIEFAVGAAQRQGRALRFSASNQNDMIDLDLLEKLAEPLRSLISVSISHSIETPAVRLGNGKRSEAEMHLCVVRHLDRVVATVEEDGAGLDEGTMKSPALAAVREAVRAKGGEVEIGHSARGGARFEIVLPLSMAVLAGMIVRAGPIFYVVPIHAIQRIVHSDTKELVYLSADGINIHVKLNSETLVPVRFLSDVSETRSRILSPVEKAEDTKCLFVIAESYSDHIALSIDEVIGEQLVIVRPMKGYLSSIRNVMGCALLANGEIGMVLDMARMME